MLHLSARRRASSACCSSGMGKAEDRAASLRRARGARRAGRRSKLGVGAWRSSPARSPRRKPRRSSVGLIAGAWDFKELKTPPPADEQRDPLEEAMILGSAAARRARRGDAVAPSAKDIRSRAVSACCRATSARPTISPTRRATSRQRHGMTVTVLGREEMEREKMGSFLCVAQGTPQDPKLIVARVSPRAAERRKPVGLVGKGLCFDSGGISIKPAQGMEWMKFDMCGAAGVLGAMEAIGRLELPVNVVGLIGSTTNMPSGDGGEAGRRRAGSQRQVHRDHQHRRRRTTRAGRRAGVRDALQARGGDRRRDAHRRLRHRARSHGDGRHGQRRRARAGSARRGQARRASRAGRCRCGTTTKS